MNNELLLKHQKANNKVLKDKLKEVKDRIAREDAEAVNPHNQGFYSDHYQHPNAEPLQYFNPEPHSPYLPPWQYVPPPPTYQQHQYQQQQYHYQQPAVHTTGEDSSCCIIL